MTVLWPPGAGDVPNSTATDCGDASVVVGHKRHREDHTPCVLTSSLQKPAMSRGRLTRPSVLPLWRERFTDVCAECAATPGPVASSPAPRCPHGVERRLRLLLVGHNPSDHSWRGGLYYSNPTNRMWGLLTGRLGSLRWDGILPVESPIEAQNILPSQYGVGLTDVGTLRLTTLSYSFLTCCSGWHCARERRCGLRNNCNDEVVG